jgi:hypothetical protein
MYSSIFFRARSSSTNSGYKGSTAAGSPRDETL